MLLNDPILRRNKQQSLLIHASGLLELLAVGLESGIIMTVASFRGTVVLINKGKGLCFIALAMSSILFDLPMSSF